MKCSMCGGDVATGAAACSFCGTPQGTAEANPFGDQKPYAPPQTTSTGSGKMEDDLGVRMLIPVGRSVHAIIAGYLGLLSLGCCPLGPFAVLFGILAIVDIRKNPNKGGIVRAILGIVLGVLASLGLVVFLIALINDGLSN